MAEVLVVVEASQAAGVKKVTLEMLTIARTLGSVSAVVLGGAGATEQFAAKLGEFGAEKIYSGEGPEIDDYLVASKATAVAELVKQVQPAAVLLASTQEGKEIAGRLAVKLDNGLLTDAVEVAADGTATQVVFAQLHDRQVQGHQGPADHHHPPELGHPRVGAQPPRPSPCSRSPPPTRTS
nr:hypothetical protein GCM10020092_016310 [Actinoplanes digitatis]